MGLLDDPSGLEASRTLLPALADLPGHLLWRAAARVTLTVAETLPSGVDLHTWAALLALDGGVARSQQDLARAVAVSRTTMVKVGAALAAQGLAERVRNPADRRSYALTRTPAGAAAVVAWQGHVQAVEDAVTAGLDADGRAELCALLRRTAGPDLAVETPAPLLGSVCFLLVRTHHRMHAAFAAGLAPLGVEPRHLGALLALRALGPVPQAELARSLGISAVTLVQVADDLEARGLLERRRDPGDRRTQLLHLLPEATGVTTSAGRTVAAVAAEHLGLDADGTARLVALLRVVVTAP